MRKYNKIREIVRARNGSQVPKLIFGKILQKINPRNIGSMSETSQIDSNTGDGEETVKKSSLFTGIKNNFAEIGKDIKNKVIQEIGTNGVNLLSQGVDFIGNQFNDVENSGGVDNAFKIGDTVAKGLGKINPALGLAGKGIMTAIKGVNSIGGKNARIFGINQDTMSQVGASYGDSVADINNAASLSGKKYGMFSNKKRRRANAAMNEAERQQNIMTDIADEAMDQRAMVNDLNYINYDFNLSGGYDQRYMRAAKSGMKLQDKINFIKQRKINTGIINLDTKEIDWEPEVIIFKTGGVIEPDYDIIYEIPKVEEFQKGGKTRTLEELIEYAKKENPRFIQRLSEDPRGINFVDEEGKNAQGSHLLGYELDEEGNAIVFPSIQEMEDGNLKYLSVWDAFDRAIEKKNFLKMTPEEAKLFTESGEDEQGNLFGYKKGWPEFFKKFKKGGTLREDLETPEIEETNQKNLIPEGALHKNKHHMEHTEGLTQKGIPVIDNDGEQQAEIELDEIIFTLEVTKKLEELYRDGSDEAAIEAGKLLVKEILFNTDDRTGLISKCEKGGKL